MDRVDLQIVRSLLTDTHHYPFRSEVRESIASIARRLGISEPTVRKRIGGLSESGFLAGWGLSVNPGIFGQRAAQVWLDVFPSSSKQDAIRKIRLIDGVFYTCRHHENRVGVCLLYDDEHTLEKRLELMARIANAENISHGQILFPPCSYRLTHSDLAVIRTIQEKPTWITLLLRKRHTFHPRQ